MGATTARVAAPKTVRSLERPPPLPQLTRTPGPLARNPGRLGYLQNDVNDAFPNRPKCARRIRVKLDSQSERAMSTRSGEDFDHPWLIERVPDEVVVRYRKAMFRVRSSKEPLVILDSLAELREVLPQFERAAVEEARAHGATWSQIAEALNRTRQAVEQRFGSSGALS